MNVKTVKLEQLGEEKIAIERESFELIQELVATTAADIIIPKDVDRKTSKQVMLIAATIATTMSLTTLALYEPEKFTEIMDDLDTAKCTVETITQKGKKELFS